MKTGIITFHSAHNYGAMLQAYALQEVVRALGADVEVIDYRMPEIDEPYQLFSPGLYLKNLRDPVALGRLLLSHSLFWRARLKKYRRFEAFMNTNLRLSVPRCTNYSQLMQYPQKYDVYICGSDQIWNPRIAGSLNPAYFLDFVGFNQGRKVSYAPSIGIDRLSLTEQRRLQTFLRDFDRISVRESTAAKYVHALTGLQCETVLDPTLLIEREKWAAIAAPPKRRGKYLLAYQMQENDEFDRVVNLISRHTGLPVVHFWKRKRFQRELFRASDAGPAEFLGLFQHASYVVTNSFHGTAFALVFRKPLLSVPHTDSGSRMVDLMQKFQFGQFIVYRADELENGVPETDYSGFDQQLSQEIRHSVDYLKEALSPPAVARRNQKKGCT